MSAQLRRVIRSALCGSPRQKRVSVYPKPFLMDIKMANGRKTANPLPKRGEYARDGATVKHILANRQYTGCTVNFKTTLVSYKVHKTVHSPEEEWQIKSVNPHKDENKNTAYLFRDIPYSCKTVL